MDCPWFLERESYRKKRQPGLLLGTLLGAVTLVENFYLPEELKTGRV